jgi:hypothetical protein
VQLALKDLQVYPAVLVTQVVLLVHKDQLVQQDR